MAEEIIFLPAAFRHRVGSCAADVGSDDDGGMEHIAEAMPRSHIPLDFARRARLTDGS
jgi:hypothetical protein